MKNPTNVFTVLPEYHEVSNTRKKNALHLLIKWAVSELESINSSNETNNNH